MKRSEIVPLPEYFERYITLVDDIPICDALKKYDENWIITEQEKLLALRDRVYAENKWTVKDILQHIIDTERIIAYRALRFARNDHTTLPGYDENSYSNTAQASRRTLDDLLTEFHTVRQSTIALFQSFSDEVMTREGICWNKQMSVVAIGFTIAGHVIHHVNIIKERYYPLLKL